MVIRPLPVKSAFVCPKRVDEIETLLFDPGEGNFQACQGVQGRRGGKQVGNGRARNDSRRPERERLQSAAQFPRWADPTPVAPDLKWRPRLEPDNTGAQSPVLRRRRMISGTPRFEPWEFPPAGPADHRGRKPCSTDRFCRFDPGILRLRFAGAAGSRALIQLTRPAASAPAARL